MNELTTIKTTELVNKNLAKKFDAINKALATIGRNTWKVAETVVTIVTPNENGNTLYQDDFETLGDLATAMSIPQSAISNMKKACAYREQIKTLDDYGINFELFSFTQILELSRLPINKLVEFMLEFEISETTTCTVIRKLVKDFLTVEESEEEVIDSDVVEESEEEVIDSDVVEESYADTDCVMHIVKINNTEYTVTESQYILIMDIIENKESFE